jgi:hypothetical protein
MDDETTVIGYGPTVQEARHDARMKVEKVKADRRLDADMDFAANASIGLAMALLAGYILLGFRVILILFTRPFAGLVLLAGFLASVFLLFGLASGVPRDLGGFLLGAGLFFGGSYVFGTLAVSGRVESWAEAIERLEGAMLLRLPGPIRIPVTLLLVFFPTIFLLSQAAVQAGSLSQGVLSVFTWGGVWPKVWWGAWALFQAATIGNRMANHPLAGRLTWYGARRPGG